ncbi:hypothetical protein MTCOM_02540 [Moorella thermoacetica]|uniref:Ig-like domain-containing protein n=1 Tax=Neomoorella thermoacetica TaxID=1525 RepID=UPI0030CDB536
MKKVRRTVWPVLAVLLALSLLISSVVYAAPLAIQMEASNSKVYNYDYTALGSSQSLANHFRNAFSWAFANGKKVAIDDTAGVRVDFESTFDHGGYAGAVEAVKNGQVPPAGPLAPTHNVIVDASGNVVEQPANAVSVNVDPASVSLTVGETQQLTVTTDPADAAVTYASDNAAVADVSATGLITAKAAGSANITVTAKKDGMADGMATVAVTVKEKTPGALTVQSVKAINASQLEVDFSQAVDETTAETVGNYTLTNATNPPKKATLQSDGKSVILNVEPMVDQAVKTKTVAIMVQNVRAKDDPNTTVTLYSGTLTVQDSTPPSIVSVKSVTNTNTASSATVQFSEPVAAGATFKIDGTSVTPVYENDENNAQTKVTFNGLSLAADQTHILQVIGLQDTAGNIISPNPTDYIFSVTKDANAPIVNNVEPMGDKSILVSFSKKMNAGTLSGNIQVKSELLDNIKIGNIAALSGDTTGTKYVIPITSPLYTDKDSRTLTVLFNDNITDELGNKLAVTTKTVTLTKDTVPPEITSVAFTKDASGNVTGIVVSFSEAIKAASYDPTGKVTVVNQNGVDCTDDLNGNEDGNPKLAAANDVPQGSTKVTFPVSPPTKLYGQYTFTFAKGLVQDASEAANDSAAYTATLDFGSAPAGELIVSDVTYSTSGTQETLTITYSDAVKGGSVAGSATDVANYSINGAPLAAGTVITLDSTQKKASIKLAPESIVQDDPAAVIRVAGVQSLKGVTVTPYVGTVPIYDNTAPVLQSAQLIDANSSVSDSVYISHIDMTFNENMAAVNEDVVTNEFTLKVGGSDFTSSVTGIKATSVDGYPKKIRLTVTTNAQLDRAKDLTIVTKAAASNVITDASTLHNPKKANVAVSITK